MKAGKKVESKKRKSVQKALIVAGVIILIAAVAAGAFFYDKISTERFLKDYNAMNGHYKQALFETGQGNRELATTEYDLFIVSLAEFNGTYTNSRPRALRNDDAFTTDLEKAAAIAESAGEETRTGNLSQAHTTLEGIRPIFNEMLRRNGLSIMSVALVDFHDSMERIMDAGDEKNAAAVLERYADADTKLKAVEAELQSDGVNDIRTALDTLKALAVAGDTDALPGQASLLKKSYVKVYLANG